MIPTTNTLTMVAMTTLPSAMIQPRLARNGSRPDEEANGCVGPVVLVTALPPDGKIGRRSMSIEDGLVGGDLLANGGRFRGSRMVRISSRRQAAQLHQAGHQQQPRLGRGQVRAADEVGVVQWHEALGVAAPDANDRKAAVHRS